MIVWGGTNTVDWLANGAVYDRTSDSWVSATNLEGAPHQREGASAAWAEDVMLIWGGWDGGNYLDDGYTYDLETDTWTSFNGMGPAGRAEHVTAWTGDQLAVWGGCNGQGCSNVLADGGRYDTDELGSWLFIGADPGLSVRVRATMVWTGTELIVWGGEDGNEPLGDGARATIP
jgi:hypothetical protein